MAEYPAGFRPQGEVGEHGHEPTDVGIRLVLTAGAILVALCVGVLGLMSWFFGGYQADERAREKSRPPLFADDRGLFPEPKLQEDPKVDLRTLRAADKDELTRYGWVDRKSGIVKIPIERAMEIVAKKGLPLAGSEPKAKTETAKPGGIK